VGPSTAICAAVKANAYGHGIEIVAPWLAAEGVEAFGAATVAEAVELRRLKITAPVFLLGSLQTDELAEAIDADVDFFVWSFDDMEALVQAARGRKKPARVHIKVDTGMGRVGCAPHETEELVRRVLHSLPLEWVGLCTHFASSDGEGLVTVAQQMTKFTEVLASISARGWTPRWIHAANSGAILTQPETYFNLVRPGIALYGYPHQEQAQFKPVMELVSKVGFVKTVPKGTSLSYGSRYQTTTDTDVATVPVGYGDGYRRIWSNRAEVWIGGRLHRVSGTVCMDQLLVDLGPQSGIRKGDPVVFFGPSTPNRPIPTAQSLAELDGTISYEVLCGISARIPRVPVTSKTTVPPVL